MGYEPWGWSPYRYGRWFWTVDLGWVWLPGRVYAPAWVSWSYYDGYVGWCPLGFYGRPATTFIGVSWRGGHCSGWSFALAGDFFYLGYGRSCYPYASVSAYVPATVQVYNDNRTIINVVNGQKGPRPPFKHDWKNGRPPLPSPGPGEHPGHGQTHDTDNGNHGRPVWADASKPGNGNPGRQAEAGGVSASRGTIPGHGAGAGKTHDADLPTRREIPGQQGRQTAERVSAQGRGNAFGQASSPAVTLRRNSDVHDRIDAITSRGSARVSQSGAGFPPGLERGGRGGLTASLQPFLDRGAGAQGMNTGRGQAMRSMLSTLGKNAAEAAVEGTSAGSGRGAGGGSSSGKGAGQSGASHGNGRGKGRGK